LGDFLDLGHVITELLKIQKRFGADLEFDNIVEDTRDGHIFVLKGDPEGDYLSKGRHEYGLFEVHL
jgi:hypothetical protein